MRNFPKFRYRKQLLQLIDIFTIAGVCFLFAILSVTLRHNLSPQWIFIHGLLQVVCIFIPRNLFGVYTSVWRYADTRTYLTLISSDLIGGAFFLAIERFLIIRIEPNQTLAPSLVVLLVVTSLVATMFTRMLYQLHHARPDSASSDNMGAAGRRLLTATQKPEAGDKINIAIVGAGSKGVLLVDSLLSSKNAKYSPYCFLDNDPEKIGHFLRGLPIYRCDNGDASIAETIKQLPIQEIVIAIDRLTAEKKSMFFNMFEKTGLNVRIYDYPFEAKSREDSAAHVRSIRDIHIEELLFRESITLHNDGVISFYRQKTILITGAGGSIGSELCRQIAKLSPKKLILLDIYENNVYDVQQELFRTYGRDVPLYVEIASVRDREKVEDIFAKYHPQIVFHAAAHKHVPLMEACADEAVKNNVFGTCNVADAAEKFHVEKFILISTDKAVNPTNIMGATKRMCEMIIQSKHDSETNFAAVRFGNVLGSNGSVIPLFMRQIEAGGPITLTDKRIIRYFMTIPEAVQLVMQAGVMAAKSEIYVLDMGKPMKILTLAENMIRLAGLRPYEDIDIQEIGLRPGEKLYEELLMKTEELTKTESESIFIERDNCISRTELHEKLDIIDRALQSKDTDTIRSAMMDVVPTYHHAESVNQAAIRAMRFKD